MATTAITLQTQAELLTMDIAASIEAIFDTNEDLQMNRAMRDALVDQAKAITVFRRDQTGKIVVSDADAYVKATEQVQALKSVSEEISETMDPYKERAFKLHKALTGYTNKLLAPIEAETKRLKAEREAFAAEQERLRREAAQKASQEAYEREQARLIEEARQVAQSGDNVAAEAILEEAVTLEVAPVILPSTVPVMSGTSFRSKWEWAIVDPTKLKPEFIQPKEKEIGAVVRSMHAGAEQLVGVGAIKVWESKIIVG
jgi:hypothetical protein